MKIITTEEISPDHPKPAPPLTHSLQNLSKLEPKLNENTGGKKNHVKWKKLRPEEQQSGGLLLLKVASFISASWIPAELIIYWLQSPHDANVDKKKVKALTDFLLYFPWHQKTEPKMDTAHITAFPSGYLNHAGLY